MKNAITVERVWKTTDGASFPDEIIAIRHQRILLAVDFLTDNPDNKSGLSVQAQAMLIVDTFNGIAEEFYQAGVLGGGTEDISFGRREDFGL